MDSLTASLRVLTCFLVSEGDLTGLIGETDTLVEGETGLQTTKMFITIWSHPFFISKINTSSFLSLLYHL